MKWSHPYSSQRTIFPLSPQLTRKHHNHWHTYLRSYLRQDEMKRMAINRADRLKFPHPNSMRFCYSLRNVARLPLSPSFRRYLIRSMVYLCVEKRMIINFWVGNKSQDCPASSISVPSVSERYIKILSSDWWWRWMRTRCLNPLQSQRCCRETGDS